MIKDPYGFWERQRRYSFPGLSWTSIVGKFTVFVTDPAIIRHVFNHNSKASTGRVFSPSMVTDCMCRSGRRIATLHGV
jgi:hypothetical protein